FAVAQGGVENDELVGHGGLRVGKGSSGWSGALGLSGSGLETPRQNKTARKKRLAGRDAKGY
ncbi:MAG TPA: hypothetical protein H9903_19095, partial [Candidatus Aquabacterium excrementipullorum]|nr:hypothetical protein [Candidatus Aquabacterium excrementipullorum]